MATYPRRLQVLLTDRQYEVLEQFARTTGKSFSGLIREAIDQTYLAKVRRREALRKLIHLNAPAGDWEQIEQEIRAGAIED